MKRILLSRDSVSMGDDSRDNRLEIEIDENWQISEILAEILRINYLPKIMFGKATWGVAYLQPVAVIAQEWEEPKLIRGEFFSYESKDFDRLHFTYFAQKDPDLVYEILRQFKTVHQ